MTTVQDLLPELTALAASVNWFEVLKIAVLVIGAVLTAGFVLKLCFGKGSSVVRALSASISIGLVYLTAVLLQVFLPQLAEHLAPLPFLLVSEADMLLLDFRLLEDGTLYTALLQLYLLACLVNCMESFLPQGKKFLSWYFLRLTVVAGSLGLYTLLFRLIETYLPQLFGDWAMYALAVTWGFILLTGILKLFLTLILAAVNPILGTVYGFFFANIFGKQLPKSILTTVLTAAIITALCHMGMSYFAFADFSLAAYGPTCVIAFVALYIFGRFL